jgi:hypothetical protein
MPNIQTWETYKRRNNIVTTEFVCRFEGKRYFHRLTDRFTVLKDAGFIGRYGTASVLTEARGVHLTPREAVIKFLEDEMGDDAIVVYYPDSTQRGTYIVWTKD